MGPFLRPLSRAAIDVIDAQPPISDHVFPGGPEGVGYAGLPGI